MFRALLRPAAIAMAAAVLLSTASASPANAAEPTPADGREDRAEQSAVEPTDETAARGYETATVGHEDYFSDAHRRQLYREGRLSHSRAALLTALLPGLGNFYAQQYFLGGLNMSTVGFAALLVPYGVLTDQNGFVWTGVGLLGAGYISGFATSWIGVDRFNRRLRRELRIAGPAARGRNQPWRATPWRAPAPRFFSLEIRF